MAELLEQIMKLPEAERLELAYSILRLSHAEESSHSLTPEQLAELIRRRDAHQTNPETAITWEELKARLKK